MSSTFNIIKYLREEKGFSQEELASSLNITRQTLSKYENSLQNMPSELVKTLSKIFEVNYACFIENKKPKQPSYNIISSENTDDSNNIRIDIPERNIDKFKQVFLYILNAIGAKANVGQTVIYKLLYFIDFDYYELYENQLMGLKYIKNTFGPTPVDFAHLTKQMQEDGDIELIKSKYYNKEMTKYLPTKEADLSFFTAQEIKHIDTILEKLSDKNASELSEFSHRDVPWIIAEDKGLIEYESVFYRSNETSVRAYNDND